MNNRSERWNRGPAPDTPGAGILPCFKPTLFSFYSNPDMTLRKGDSPFSDIMGKQGRCGYSTVHGPSLPVSEIDGLRLYEE
jgi:hypothetical protein